MRTAPSPVATLRAFTPDHERLGSLGLTLRALLIWRIERRREIGAMRALVGGVRQGDSVCLPTHATTLFSPSRFAHHGICPIFCLKDDEVPAQLQTSTANLGDELPLRLPLA